VGHNTGDYSQARWGRNNYRDQDNDKNLKRVLNKGRHLENGSVRVESRAFSFSSAFDLCAGDAFSVNLGSRQCTLLFGVDWVVAAKG